MQGLPEIAGHEMHTVLETRGGAELWQQVFKSDEEFLRGANAFTWHPHSSALFFCSHELTNDDALMPNTSKQPHAVMFSAGIPHHCDFWKALEDEDFMDVSVCIPAPDGSWVACIESCPQVFAILH